MERPRDTRGRFAALLVIALLAGCGPAPTPPPTEGAGPASPATSTSAAPSGSAPASSGSPSPSAAAVKVPLARWTDCGKGFLCAEVHVAKDYRAPSKGVLNLSLIKLVATEPDERIGSLLVNPGGPGGSGVDFVRDGAGAGVFSAALRKRFDIVGFDPRGVNSSSAIRCIDNLDPRARLDPSPDTAAELKALVDSSRSYAAECGKRSDATLPYLSTDAVARDLDTLRAAVGDDKLSYLGYSYGTLIGSTYADLFPDHIRAMVLDGAIDPGLDLEHLRSGQAKAFETALSHFLEDCARKSSCAFHEGGRSVQVFDSLMASIERKPLPATRLVYTRNAGPSVAWYSVLAALYSKLSWPALAASLESARRGDGTLMVLIADPFRGRKANGTYSNLQDAYTANTCLDFAAPKDVKVYTGWADKLKATAPHFAGLMAYNDLPCAFWPVPAQRTPKAVKAAGAPPIVVVGSTGDPATPYPWAVALAKQLESGVLITRTGEGHTGYQASLCVQRAVDAYLLDLKAPADGLKCK
jgi:pimeloyl-ACP methyl ester carboxylesterase